MIKEAQKAEAIARMKMLKLHKNVLREFRDEDKVNLSENKGILYWLDEKQRSYVADFEARYGVLVYHIIHDYTEFGELLSFLYVSKYRSEWEYERRDLANGVADAYVKNVTDEECSEFGAIRFETRFGGLVRTA